MINEEASRSSLNIQVKLAKATAQGVLNVVKWLHSLGKGSKDFENAIGSNGKNVKLKDLVAKGQVEDMPIKDAELKELKKELKKDGVNFSIVKNKETKEYTIFFQAKDANVMYRAFDKAVKKAEKKIDRKESIRKKIENFKQKAKETIAKDKIKNKHKEQSLWCLL